MRVSFPGGVSLFIFIAYIVVGRPTFVHQWRQARRRGGSGFAIVIARDIQAAQDLPFTLAARYPGTPVEIWPSGIPDLDVDPGFGVTVVGEPCEG